MSSDKANSKPDDQQHPKTYEVTAEGSLGLLALGAQGIRAWRKKRDEEKAKSVNKPYNE